MWTIPFRNYDIRFKNMPKIAIEKKRKKRDNAKAKCGSCMCAKHLLSSLTSNFFINV